jgi:hypothetical protein
MIQRTRYLEEQAGPRRHLIEGERFSDPWAWE